MARPKTCEEAEGNSGGWPRASRPCRPLWRWALERRLSRREGDTLDFDSTARLHEDGRQQGVRVGHTCVGLKRCLAPRLAVLAEVKRIAQCWLARPPASLRYSLPPPRRPGHALCANHLLAFTLDRLGHLPRHLRVRRIRADRGFHYDPWLCHSDPWLCLLESQGRRDIGSPIASPRSSPPPPRSWRTGACGSKA